MLIESIIAPVGKSNPSFDLQTDIIFGGNGGAKINKILDCVKSIVIGRCIRESIHRTTLLVENIYFVLPSLTARPILVDSPVR